MRVTYEPDPGALRTDIATLSGIVRDSAGPGERAAAAWAAERLRAAGAADVVVEPYRGRVTNSWSFAAHSLAGLAAARVGGAYGAALALAALASLERDVSGRAPWRRRIAGGGEGASVVGRFPPRGEPRARVVLVAHLDAARTGLVWSPRIVAIGAARALRRRGMQPVMGLQAIALAAAAGAALTSRHGPRAAHRALATPAIALNALAIALNLEIARSPVVPGANDNASGVAAALDLAQALAAGLLGHTEVLVALVGGEETGMGGFHAVLDRRTGLLDASSTLVVGLDTLGCGTPIVAAAEGAVLTHRYRDVDLDLADEGAALAGEPSPQRWRIGAWTDPLLALRAGLPALSLLSVGSGFYPHYHHPTDLPEHVDLDCVARCARIAHGVLRAFDARVDGPSAPPARASCDNAAP
ncbi:MAG: M28 family metallopeptidase [Solirubrobacteraceae bacterium]|nr:M28 family metallopeptidase [Solirubrobacteraceae bacterium]